MNIIPITPPNATSIWRDPWFYRGVLLVPLLEAVGFIVMVIIQPETQTSFVFQNSFAVVLLISALVILPRRRRFGLGMVIGWFLFVLFPVAWVLLLGFSGNLM